MNFDEIIQQPGQKELVLKDDIFKSLHVSIPGEVVSYDETSRTVVVQPTIRDINTTAKPPLLVDVPVFMWGNYLFTPQPGDRCLVVIADSCIDGWFQNGGVSSPIVNRHHDLSDGFAFIGFNRTGGEPISGGGGGGAGCVIHEYTVTNTSGSYSHTFTDSSILQEMKPILVEFSNPSVFATNNVEVIPADGEVTINSDSVSGTSTVTVTFIGGPGQGNYVFIRYSATQPTQDSDMKTTPDEWMGIYVGTSVTAPTSYTLYTWYKIKGEQGYSPTASVSKTGNTTTITITDKNGTSSAQVLDGEKGDSVTITSTTVSYASSSSGTVTPSSWQSTVPTVPQGDYLWTKTEVVYSTGDSTITYSAVRNGIDGSGSVSSVAGVQPDNTGDVPKNSLLELVYPVGSIYMSVNSTAPSTLFGGTWEAIQGKFLLSQDSSHTAGTTGGAASVSYTPAGTNTGGSVSNHTLTIAQIPAHNHSFTGSQVDSGGISANHTHTGTSGNPSANHTHSGPNHNHSVNTNNTWTKAGNSAVATGNVSSSQTKSTVDAGTGATGTVSAWHTHTTTTGNQSTGHTHKVTASGSIGNKGDGGAHNHGFTNPTFTGTAATIATMPPYLSVYMWKRTA